MSRFWARVISTAVVAALGGSAIPACAHDDATIFIRQVMAPPVTVTNGQCLYTADPTQPYLNSGAVDAALATSYQAVLLVGNQMQPRGTAEEVRAETARISVQGALVRVVDPADGSTVMNNTVLSAATIDPGGGANAAYALVGVTMLNAKAVAHFDPGTIGAPSRVAIAYVKVFGQTLGGQSVESNEFQFPIYVCHGCLVSFPAGAASTNACQNGGTVSSNAQKPCVIGNDAPIDCSFCYPNAVCNPANR